MERQQRSQEMLKESIAVYRDTLGIKSQLFVLCDSSFLRFRFLHPEETAQMLVDISGYFGVENLVLKTTWCVVQDMEIEVKKAQKKHAEWLYEKFQEYTDEPWWREKAQDLAANVEYWKEVKKFALGFEAVCEHESKPMSSGACILRCFETKISEPFIMGTCNRRRCEKVLQICGKPSVLIKLYTMTIEPFAIKSAQKEKLENLKAQRLEIAQKAVEEMKGDEEELEQKGDEEELVGIVNKRRKRRRRRCEKKVRV